MDLGRQVLLRVKHHPVLLHEDSLEKLDKLQRHKKRDAHKVHHNQEPLQESDDDLHRNILVVEVEGAGLVHVQPEVVEGLRVQPAIGCVAEGVPFAIGVLHRLRAAAVLPTRYRGIVPYRSIERREQTESSLDENADEDVDLGGLLDFGELRLGLRGIHHDFGVVASEDSHTNDPLGVPERTSSQ